MKRALVITLVKDALDESFGPAMQIFATQHVLQDYAVKAETMVDANCKRTFFEKLFRGLDELRSGVTGVKHILNKIGRNSPQAKSIGITSCEKKLIKKRKENYQEFIQQYVTISNVTEEDIVNHNSGLQEFDYFVIGSDQVWNPYYPQRDEIKYLEFCDSNQKITMAPSIALADIPRRFRKRFRRGMLSFDKICVREEAAVHLIENYTGKQAETMIDPTMLISADEYRKMKHIPDCMPTEKFILVYMMGYEQSNDQIKELADQLGLKIVWLRQFLYPEYYVLNPLEYLALIDAAELICTDSFHMSVFSLLFHKAFLVIERDANRKSGMGSRITNLLHIFGVDIEIQGIKNYKNAYHIQYDIVDQILEDERRKAYDYLDHVIGGRTKCN